MKKKTVDSKKIIFATILIAIGIFVVSLFSLTLLQANMTGQVEFTLHTQLVEDGYSEPSPSATMDDQAQVLIVIGALVFSLLGGVIFLGLKIHDRYL